MTQQKGVQWSYSSLTAFETCPRRYYLTKVSKQVQEPQTTATIHGNEVHKAIELDLKGQQVLPEKYSAYKPYVDAVKLAPGKKIVEHKIALTGNLTPTTYFGKDVWMRSVIDAGVIGTKYGVLVDWKTGKRKTDSEQMRLFAAVGFTVFPFLDKIKTGFAWLPAKVMDEEEFTKADVPAIWRDFSIRVQRLEHALRSDDFPPKPSGLCREWCPVGRKLCEHCGS